MQELPATLRSTSTTTDQEVTMPHTALPRADHDQPITAPTTCAPYEVGDGITILPSYLPVPGLGVLPAHAFVIDGPEPMLVDTGPGGTGDAFREALASVLDPRALRFVWLTHTDPDHTGSLAWLLDELPDLRLVTTYLAVGKLSMTLDVPMDRLWWVNPGTTIDVNGRELEALRPPSFDAPETVAVFDHRSSTLFSADTFGAVLDAPALDAGAIGPEALGDGMRLWSTIDAPWLAGVDRRRFARSLDAIRARQPRRVLSSHLPPAHGIADRLFDLLRDAPDATPWDAPDQAALEQMWAAAAGSGR
jgi:glyoxylase-like metal-dependent hydrolase (beta-lactamase superfamily II)